jgi:hypothetical protein
LRTYLTSPWRFITGAPGTGKSVTLRILAERLAAQRDGMRPLTEIPSAVSLRLAQPAFRPHGTEFAIKVGEIRR